uniref:Uncharacterized protein n=1 Tax=Trichuris muris TaxID=70415 RepID=A0A5S6QH73_TRIMR
MHSAALVVACLLTATTISFPNVNTILPKALQSYLDNSKVEEPPVDKNILDDTKKYLDKKLEAEEESLLWALKSDKVKKIDGDNSGGELHVHFNATIAKCPSNTQKELCRKLQLAIKYMRDYCKDGLMKRQFSCSLSYNKFNASSSVKCAQKP